MFEYVLYDESGTPLESPSNRIVKTAYEIGETCIFIYKAKSSTSNIEIIDAIQAALNFECRSYKILDIFDELPLWLQQEIERNKNIDRCFVKMI